MSGVRKYGTAKAVVGRAMIKPTKVVKMTAKMTIGTGRATCRICYKTIKKGQLSVTIVAYQATQQIHSLPGDCDVKQRTSNPYEKVKK